MIRRWPRMCFFVLALCAALAVGCDLPGKPDPALRPIPPHDVTDFALLFQRNCSGCHGADGRLGPAPPLNDPLFLSLIPDEELLRVVREGRRGTPMPGFAPAAGGQLTDEQVRIVAEGIKKQWSSSTVEAAAHPAYAVGAGDAARGEVVFAKACAACHGEQGLGGKAGANRDASLLALMSDQVLRRIIITGRPDLGMPTYAGRDGRDGDFQPLTSAEINDLTALLARWRSATLPPAPIAAASNAN